MHTFIFVCRGNTCRSAMALAIARHLTGPVPGLRLDSAGLEAFEGMAASALAVKALAARGIDLSGHRAKMLTPQLASWATKLFTMTPVRVSRLVTKFPKCASRTFLIDPTGREIPDPIGGTLADYVATAEALDRSIRTRFSEYGLLRP